MRFYDSPSIERIGFDFYCDIANNIVKLRESIILLKEQKFRLIWIICRKKKSNFGSMWKVEENHH